MLRRMRTDILAEMERMAETYGDVAYVPIGRGAVFLRGHEAMRHVLVTEQDRYPKADVFQLFRPALGDGLVTSDGETWRTSRRMVQPMFAKRHLGAYAGHITAASTEAVDRWAVRWQSDVVAIDQAILTVGLDTVGRALASHDFTRDAERFEDAMGSSLTEIREMATSPLTHALQDLTTIGITRLAQWTTPRRWRRYHEAVEVVDEMIAALVDERLLNGHGDRDDLLRLLMESTDPDSGEGLTRKQVMDEVKTLVAAGHETTAHGLSWMFHLLAQCPEAERRLHAEVDAVLGTGTVLTVEVVDEQLGWTAACFKEAMRVIPPVWHLPRRAAVDDVIGGYRIPAGARVLPSIWATHRDPAVYADPTVFRPERWLGDEPRLRPRFSYLPFGGGRRACVGQGFAMLNATILGATIAHRFRFEALPGTVASFEPTITTRPRDPLFMRALPRVSTAS
ncbi:MAG: cytochrome P450 [Solirubrobacteraceae bacterium]|nr:cytochrome P450 [Solirubrobacteraceae bacterium]